MVKNIVLIYLLLGCVYLLSAFKFSMKYGIGINPCLLINNSLNKSMDKTIDKTSRKLYFRYGMTLLIMILTNIVTWGFQILAYLFSKKARAVFDHISDECFTDD